MFTRRPPAIAAAAAQQRLCRILARSWSPGQPPPLGFGVRLVGQASILRSICRGWEP